MVKLLGAVMTGGACAYLGIRIRMTLRTREKTLAALITSLEMLESEISFSVNRLKKALKSSDRTGIFTLAADKIGEMTAGEALAFAVESGKTRLCLTGADCEAILTLAPTLGKTDCAEQIKSIRYVKSLISQLHKTAQSDSARLGKLYALGGVLVGLFIVIVLI